MSTDAVLFASSRVPANSGRQVTLLDLLDRLLAGGVVVFGQIRLAVADVDLVDLDLALVLSSVEKFLER